MINSLSNIMGLNKNKNSSIKERLILETIVFKHLCGELKKHFMNELDGCNKNLIKMEMDMADGVMIHKLVNDLLLNNDYSISGLACYTGYPEEVIYDLAAGINNNPTIALSNKIIELHFLSRRDLYISVLENLIKSK